MSLGPRSRVACKVALFASSVLGGSALAASRLVWNVTASVPLGLYQRAGDAPARKGSLVMLPVPPSARTLASERRYLPDGFALLKVVVATPGDHVCLDGGRYEVNGHTIAAIRTADSAGRPLEAFHFCGSVPADQVFVATAAPLSFDSRYFGPVPLTTLTLVKPLWTYSR